MDEDAEVIEVATAGTVVDIRALEALLEARDTSLATTAVTTPQHISQVASTTNTTTAAMTTATATRHVEAATRVAEEAITTLAPLMPTTIAATEEAVAYRITAG